MKLARSVYGPELVDPATYDLIMDPAIFKRWAAAQGIDAGVALAQWRSAKPQGIFVGCGPVSYWSPGPQQGRWGPKDNPHWSEDFLVHTSNGDLHEWDGLNWIDFSNEAAAHFMAEDTAAKFNGSVWALDGVHVDRTFQDPRILHASWIDEIRWIQGLVIFFYELRRLLPEGALIQANGLANDPTLPSLAPWVDGIVMEDWHRDWAPSRVVIEADQYQYALIGAGRDNPHRAIAEAVVAGCRNAYFLTKETP